MIVGSNASQNAAQPSTVLWVAYSALVLVLGAYWWVLLDNQRSQLAYAESQLKLRAEQTSEALATQIQVVMSGLDYLGKSLATRYLEIGRASCRERLSSTGGGLPRRATG